MKELMTRPSKGEVLSHYVPTETSNKIKTVSFSIALVTFQLCKTRVLQETS